MFDDQCMEFSIPRDAMTNILGDEMALIYLVGIEHREGAFCVAVEVERGTSNLSSKFWKLVFGINATRTSIATYKLILSVIHEATLHEGFFQFHFWVIHQQIV